MLLIVSILNLTAEGWGELLIGLLVLLFAVLCAIVAVSEARSNGRRRV